jgi:hypothetical protein
MANGSIQVVSTDSGKTLGTLDSNPPSIESRIARLRETLKKGSGKNPAIKRSLAHWKAASINTRRLEATHRLVCSGLEITDQQERCTEVYQNIDAMTSSLAAKRGELSRFEDATRFQTAGPEIRTEYEATRRAIELRLAAATDAHDQAVEQWLTERSKLEGQLANHFSIQHDINSLTRAYRDALPAAPETSQASGYSP